MTKKKSSGRSNRGAREYKRMKMCISSKNLTFIALIYLVNLPVVVLPRALGIRHYNDPLSQPIVWLFFGPLLASNSQLALKLLNETVLGAALVEDEWAHLPADKAIPVHGVNVGGFLGASNHRLDLRQQGQRSF